MTGSKTDGTRKVQQLVGRACERCNGDGYYMCEYRGIDVPCPDCEGIGCVEDDDIEMDDIW